MIRRLHRGASGTTRTVDDPELPLTSSIDQDLQHHQEGDIKSNKGKKLGLSTEVQHKKPHTGTIYGEVKIASLLILYFIMICCVLQSGLEEYKGVPNINANHTYRAESIINARTSSTLDCNVKNITNILVKGERHSGTNLIQSILFKNRNGTHKDDPLRGWKHGFLPPRGWGKPISAENEILLVVTRDVFAWLPSMYKEPYDGSLYQMKQRSGRTFSKYLQMNYTTSCHGPNENKKDCRQTNSRGECILSKDQYEFCNEPQDIVERAANLIQIRTQKYKDWLSDNPPDETFVGSKELFLRNRVHVRLESVVAINDYDKAIEKSRSQRIFSSGTTGMSTSHSWYKGEDHTEDETMQRRVIGEQLNNRCVPINENFQEILQYKTVGKKTVASHKSYNSQVLQKMLLKKYSALDLRFVLRELDLDFEKSLGYDYDYVFDFLEEQETIS